MRKIDFQEAMHDFQPCAHLGTVLKLICYKYKITRQDFLVLLEVNALNEFSGSDFTTAELTAGWDKRRLYRWKDEGLVYVSRQREGRYKNYDIYECTRKAKKMIRVFNDYLSGAVAIPEQAYSANAKYSSRMLTKKINTLNGTT